MFESIINFFKRIGKSDKEQVKSKDAAKERLHLVLMQDRANVSADFLDLMKQEIIEVIKKYIDVDENSIDVRLTNKANADGTTGAPALYANIPIVSIKEEVKGKTGKEDNKQETKPEKKEESKQEEKQNTQTENTSSDSDKNESEQEKVEEPQLKNQANEENESSNKENEDKKENKEIEENKNEKVENNK